MSCRLRNLALALALPIALAAPATALPLATKFVHAETGYVIRVVDTGSRQIISGRHPTSGESFRLRVLDRQVSGNWNGRPVSFRLGEAPPAALVVAAR